MDLIYPADLKNSDRYPGWISFHFYKRRSMNTSEPTDKIALYMPEGVSQPSTVNWDTEKFGMVGNVITSAGSAFYDNPSMQGVGEALSAGWAAMEGSAHVTAARVIANVGSAAATLLGGNVSAEGIMGEVMGKIPNPYLHMIFRGVDFRSFSFVFKFFPYSQEDCELIDNIIKTFRANALPSFGEETGQAFLGYPSEVKIEYQWEGKQNPWLHRFKTAVCTGVDVDYAAAGNFAMMRNGMPSAITVATKWSEIELVTRNDVFRNGVDGGY